MKWSSLPPAKKGLIIGLIFGLILTIYATTTDCNVGFGGISGCNNSLGVIIGYIEFPLLLIALPLTLLRVPSVISLVASFALVGFLVGFIVGKVKKRKIQE
jgi:hypothetical protein